MEVGNQSVHRAPFHTPVLFDWARGIQLRCFVAWPVHSLPTISMRRFTPSFAGQIQH